MLMKWVLFNAIGFQIVNNLLLLQMINQLNYGIKKIFNKLLNIKLKILKIVKKCKLVYNVIATMKYFHFLYLGL